MKKLTISTIIISAAMLISAAFPGVNAGAAYTDIPSPVSHIEEIPPSEPTAPTGIKITTTSDSATISWNKVPGASKYNIYFYAPSVKKYKLYYTTSNTSYTVKNLKSNSGYTLKISAATDTYESSLSAKKKFTTKTASSSSSSSSSSLSAPTGITATTTETTATISWNKVSGASKYNIYFYASSEKKYKLYYTASNTSYTVKNLKSNSGYTFKISAATDTYESSLSAKKKFTTKKSSALAAPTDFSFSTSGTTVKLKWGKVDGASSYNIYFHEYSSDTYKQYYTTQNTYYEVKNLVSNGYYTVKLSAVDSSGKESELSHEFRFLVGVNYDTSYSPSSESTWDYINPKEQGTATNIDGKTVVVTIFASCKNAVWDLSGADKKAYSELYKYVGVATEWLSSEVAGYGKKAEFVYDWKEHPDLLYTFDFSKTMNTKDMSDTEKIYLLLQSGIDKNIDTAAIKTQYKADNVVFLTFFNFKPTNEQRSATYWYKSSYSFAYGYKYPYETVFIYNKSFYPGVIAHEMLHTFGAPDLYCSSDKFGITDEYVKSIEKDKLNDIMRITWDLKSGNYLLNNLNNKITDITAYYLGLTDSSATVNKLKMKKRENTY